MLVARVFNLDGFRSVHLYATDEGLEVMVDQQNKEASLVLTPRGVRELRLALQRYERSLNR